MPGHSCRKTEMPASSRPTPMLFRGTRRALRAIRWSSTSHSVEMGPRCALLPRALLTAWTAACCECEKDSEAKSAIVELEGKPAITE